MCAQVLVSLAEHTEHMAEHFVATVHDAEYLMDSSQLEMLCHHLRLHERKALAEAKAVAAANTGGGGRVQSLLSPACIRDYIQ